MAVGPLLARVRLNPSGADLAPAERRAILLVALIYLGGAAWDLWRADAPPPSLSGHAVAGLPAGGGPSGPQAPADSGGPIPRRASGPAAAPGPIQINRASASELDALPGIGPVLAARIMRHREAHGPFRTLEELGAVRGVGHATIVRLRPLVAVDSL
jgi:competence ComEA-like helix-hairpin-helix protein